MFTKTVIENLKDTWETWDLDTPFECFELCLITVAGVFILMLCLLFDICALPVEIIALTIYMLKKRWK